MLDEMTRNGQDVMKVLKLDCHDTTQPPEKWIDCAKKLGLDVDEVWSKLFAEKGQSAPSAMGEGVEAPTSAAKHGITKGQVIGAFQDLHFDADKWSKYLGDPPNWLKDCQVTKGKQGDNKVSATWNPVLIAVALLDKKVNKNKLNAVFVQLKDWADEWREVSANDR